MPLSSFVVLEGVIIGNGVLLMGGFVIDGGSLIVSILALFWALLCLH